MVTKLSSCTCRLIVFIMSSVNFMIQNLLEKLFNQDFEMLFHDLLRAPEKSVAVGSIAISRSFQLTLKTKILLPR